MEKQEALSLLLLFLRRFLLLENPRESGRRFLMRGRKGCIVYCGQQAVYCGQHQSDRRVFREEKTRASQVRSSDFLTVVMNMSQSASASASSRAIPC